MIDLKAIEERAERWDATGVMADIPALCQEIRELRLALLCYGDHLCGCDSRYLDFVSDEPDAPMRRGTCDCGWDELKKRLENANG